MEHWPKMGYYVIGFMHIFLLLYKSLFCMGGGQAKTF